MDTASQAHVIRIAKEDAGLMCLQRWKSFASNRPEKAGVCLAMQHVAACRLIVSRRFFVFVLTFDEYKESG